MPSPRRHLGDDPLHTGLIGRYDDVVSRREDLVHSHPATQPCAEHEMYELRAEDRGRG